MQTGNKAYIGSLIGKYKNVDELRNLVIAYLTNGLPVRLIDLADIQDAQKEVEKIPGWIRKRYCIQIIKQSDANAVAVAEEIRAG